jgi:hypothetical protein
MSNQPIQIFEHRMRVFSGAEADGVRQAGVVGTGFRPRFGQRCDRGTLEV